MVAWNLVLDRLNETAPVKYGSLDKILRYLYERKKLSTWEIAQLTRGECSRSSLQMKMRELGITLRGRGGANQHRG